ncbi:MAG: formyltransferase [Betaproteobacteria bacterium]
MIAAPGASAVVFAYSSIGARCLRVLVAHGIDVRLVLTHEDDPAENAWFERVADVATDLGLPWIAPADPHDAQVVARIASLAPDFVFSFYYRLMLKPDLLGLAARGALNLHGSLLPKYRGRAPVNWAVLKGARQTGATLHYMADKPDAGDIVDQQAVPILPDDTAADVAAKVTVAAEITLDRVIDALVAGTAPRRRNPIEDGSYFGGRTSEDGRIDWLQHASTIHNLVRAVAPPYPGAVTTVGGREARVLRTRVLERSSPPAVPPTIGVAAQSRGSPDVATGECLIARCGGGGTLRIDALEIDGEQYAPAAFRAAFGGSALPLG